MWNKDSIEIHAKAKPTTCSEIKDKSKRIKREKTDGSMPLSTPPHLTSPLVASNFSTLDASVFMLICLGDSHVQGLLLLVFQLHSLTRTLFYTRIAS